jgi:hypothetical protein
MDRDNRTERTSNFLFAQPSSNAGSSTPFKRESARNAPSGSTNSAKPKPCGFAAGVMSRLKEFIGPHACNSSGNVHQNEKNNSRRGVGLKTRQLPHPISIR